MNTITTPSGAISPVCKGCGRHSSPRPSPLNLWDMDECWTAIPFPSDYQHADGTTGTIYRCPDCSTAWREQ